MTIAEFIIDHPSFQDARRLLEAFIHLVRRLYQAMTTPKVPEYQLSLL